MSSCTLVVPSAANFSFPLSSNSTNSTCTPPIPCSEEFIPSLLASLNTRPEIFLFCALCNLKSGASSVSSCHVFKLGSLCSSFALPGFESESTPAYDAPIPLRLVLLLSVVVYAFIST